MVWIVSQFKFAMMLDLAEGIMFLIDSLDDGVDGSAEVEVSSVCISLVDGQFSAPLIVTFHYPSDK